MKPKTFFSGIQIPEQTRGDVQIKHKKISKGSKVTIVSARNAIFDGRRPSYTIADKDYYMHELSYAGGVWMTDSLQEIEQMKIELHDMRGRVLIGGLGLGTMLHYLPEKVRSTVVVESDARIINMVAPYLPELGTRDEIIHLDIFDFVRTIERNQFDYAFLDVWQLTSEITLAKYVVPLRMMLDELIPQKNIRCWAEREMWGQVEHGLRGWIELYFELETWREQHQKDDFAEIRMWAQNDKVKSPFWQWFVRERPTKKSKTVNALNDFLKRPLHWYRQERIDLLAPIHVERALRPVKPSATPIDWDPWDGHDGDEIATDDRPNGRFHE